MTNFKPSLIGVVWSFRFVFHTAVDWSVALFPLHFMLLITQVKTNLDVCSPHHSEIRARHWRVQHGRIPNALFWVEEAWLKTLHSLISFIWHLGNTETTGTRLQGARDQDMKDFQRWYKRSVSWLLGLLYYYHAPFNIPNCVLKMKTSTICSLWLNRWESVYIFHSMSPSRIQGKQNCNSFLF